MTQIDSDSVRRALYRAAGDPDEWVAALSGLRELIGGEMVVIEQIDTATGSARIGFNDRPVVVAGSRTDYEAHYALINPRTPVMNRLAVGGVLSDRLVGDEDELERYEFYADFLRPYGLKYVIGAKLEEVQGRVTALSVHRAPDRGPVSDRAIDIFKGMLGDIKTALDLTSRIETLRARQHSAEMAWEMLTMAIAWVAPDGRVRHANTAMRRLMDTAGPLSCIKGRLSARTARANARLRSCLAAAWISRAPRRCLLSEAPHALVLTAAPLDQMRAPDGGGPEDGLVVVAGLAEAPTNPDHLCGLFGLTATEGRLAALLTDGHSLVSAATALKISHNTARTHMAAIREKLSVSSQIAAVAVMRAAANPFH